MHTPSTAARATGLAKSTIYRAIKVGRLPAHKLEVAHTPSTPLSFAARSHQHHHRPEQRAWRAPTLSASLDGMSAERAKPLGAHRSADGLTSAQSLKLLRSLRSAMPSPSPSTARVIGRSVELAVHEQR
jgi:hypothetical protein